MANGLINLQTDLKSLRYGSDKPYITKNIGQAPGSQLGMEVQSRIDDTSRIAQMLIDKPGIKYLLNEALLQQINIDDKIRNRGNKTVAGAVLGQLGNTLVGTAKILGSTLAQVPVNGTGLHFLKGFRTDTYLQPTNGNQASGFAQFFGAGGVEGAPLALQGKPIEGIVESKFGQKISPVEFKVTAESNLDYDEKVNTLIPNISSYVYAKEGTTIIEDNVGIDGWKPYTNTGVKEQFVDRNTNKILSQSKFIDPAVQNKSRIKASGSVVSSAITLSNPFGGAPLSIPGIQTTVTPGVKTSQNLITGSLSNKDVKHNLGDNGIGVNQKYTSTSTYTGKDSVYNISQALTGSSVIPTGGEQPTDLIKGISINQSKSEPQYEKSHETPTTSRRYTEGNKYYEEQKNRKIGDSQKNVIREKRVGLGDQSKRNKSGIAYYTNPTDDEIDQINYLDVTTVRPEGAGVGRDLAKLYFEIITPDAQPRFLYFRAFIDNFDDGYTADWQAHKYVGRAENFYTYGGFDRDITLSFKVAAATRVEMKPLYKKMVYLASATAPTYGGMMTKYMRGTFAKMTVGSYLDQTPGVITSVKYNLIEGMPWEIAMGQPEGVEPESQVLPMGMQCAVTFRPIHTFAPQTGLYPYFTNASQDPRYFTEDDAVLT
jgi:hypothetical protein